MAKEYIERSEALNAIERSCWTEFAYDRVEQLPAADVVEVVRCGECNFYKNGTCHSPYIGCGYVNPQMKTNDFCSYGERRNNNAQTD